MPLITPDRFIALKSAVKAEIKRRSYGKGAISSTYYGSSYDYSVTPTSGQVVKTEYLTKNGKPLSLINSNVIPDPSSSANRVISGNVAYNPTSSSPVNPSTVTAGDISKMEAAVAYWGKISDTVTTASATGCKSSCTGLCYTGCSTECDGSCSGDCSGDCYGSCDGGCRDNCAAYCEGSCDSCDDECMWSCTFGNQ